MRRKASLVAAAAIAVLALLGTAASAASVAPKTVGTDPKGDWGGGGQGNAQLGNALGQDLVSASIGMPTKKTVDFTIKLTSLPPIGGVPEITRYIWDSLTYNVGSAKGNFVELDGKFTNYSRGACDPTSGQCPPPRDPGMAPFIVRSDCTTNAANVTTCKEIGLVHAAFDAAKATVTIPVPTKLLKLKACSEIAAGPNPFGGSISASPAVFLSESAFPMDSMTVTKAFQLPSRPGTKCPNLVG